MAITQSKTNIISNKIILTYAEQQIIQVSKKGNTKYPEKLQCLSMFTFRYACRAIHGLLWHVMVGIIMYSTPEKLTDKTLLRSLTNHCHAMKGIV